MTCVPKPELCQLMLIEVMMIQYFFKEEKEHCMQKTCTLHKQLMLRMQPALYLSMTWYSQKIKIDL